MRCAAGGDTHKSAVAQEPEGVAHCAAPHAKRQVQYQPQRLQTSERPSLSVGDTDMLDPDHLHSKLIGGAAALLVALLTVPAIAHTWKTFRPPSQRGYAQLAGNNSYEDRDGIATEDSIRAYSDTRPRVAVWLGAVIGLAVSIAAQVLSLRDVEDTTRSLAELDFWTEPACWVRRDILRAHVVA